MRSRSQPLVRPARAFARVLPLWLVLCGFGPVPEGQPERAVFLDLQKIVDSRARFEWIADKVEAELATPQAMRSLCRVDLAARDRLRTWVTTQVAGLGGPAADQFKAGVELSELTDVLRLERVRAILDVVEPRLAGECGFWSQPSPDFDGIQVDAHRVMMLLETNGGAQIYLGPTPLKFGGAGTGRVLMGYGIDDRFTLATGFELGAASTFPKNEETGTRSVKATFLGGAPMLLRYSHSTFLYDTDLAFTFRAPEDDLEGWQYGIRFMQGLGTSELRIGNFMGYLVFFTAYEVVPGNVSHDTAHILRFGTRLGIDWTPWDGRW